MQASMVVRSRTTTAVSRCWAAWPPCLPRGSTLHGSRQVIHGHDWHTGLAPAYLRAASARHGRRLAGTVFTVHNLAYQGLFPMTVRADLGLPSSFFRMPGPRVFGQVSFLEGRAGSTRTSSPR